MMLTLHPINSRNEHPENTVNMQKTEFVVVYICYDICSPRKKKKKKKLKNVYRTLLNTVSHDVNKPIR